MAEELEKTASADKDVLKFLRHHYELKNFMAACARNPFVARAIVPCYAMSRRFYYLHHREDPDLIVAAKYHTEVVRAVVLGDEAKASAASDRLMDYIVEFTRATIIRF
jgi:DNA-binding GntR family transcriptional regulator